MFLSDINQNELASSEVLLEAVEYFEYGKNNNGYKKKENLLKQVIEKALPIVKALYPGCQLLFLFENTTSYLVLVSDVI